MENETELPLSPKSVVCVNRSERVKPVHKDTHFGQRQCNFVPGRQVEGRFEIRKHRVRRGRCPLDVSHRKLISRDT